MTYEDARSLLPPEDELRATVFAMNNLLQLSGTYNRHQFEQQVIIWTQSHYQPTQVEKSDFILWRVASHFKISVESIKTRSNEQGFAYPRQVAMYLMHALTEWSLPKIGRLLQRHHSTVVHSIEKIKARREVDADLNNFIAITSGEFDDRFNQNGR